MKKIKKLIPVLLIVGVILFVLLFIFAFIRHGFGPGIQDYSLDLSSSCILHRMSAHNVFVRCLGPESSLLEIGPKVTHIISTGQYIGVRSYPLKPAYPDEPQRTYEVPDKSSPYWWILNINSLEKSGPFLSEEEYQAQINTLGLELVPLTSVDRFKNSYFRK